jgi:hypothetical protein
MKKIMKPSKMDDITIILELPGDAREVTLVVQRNKKDYVTLTRYAQPPAILPKKYKRRRMDK